MRAPLIVAPRGAPDCAAPGCTGRATEERLISGLIHHVCARHAADVDGRPQRRVRRMVAITLSDAARARVDHSANRLHTTRSALIDHLIMVSPELTDPTEGKGTEK